MPARRWWWPHDDEEVLRMEFTIKVTFDLPADKIVAVPVIGHTQAIQSKGYHGLVLVPGVGYIDPKQCVVIDGIRE